MKTKLCVTIGGLMLLVAILAGSLAAYRPINRNDELPPIPAIDPDAGRAAQVAVDALPNPSEYSVSSVSDLEGGGWCVTITDRQQPRVTKVIVTPDLKVTQVVRSR